jgi:hypothetical protein
MHACVDCNGDISHRRPTARRCVRCANARDVRNLEDWKRRAGARGWSPKAPLHASGPKTCGRCDAELRTRKGQRRGLCQRCASSILNRGGFRLADRARRVALIRYLQLSRVGLAATHLPLCWWRSRVSPVDFPTGHLGDVVDDWRADEVERGAQARFWPSVAL